MTDRKINTLLVEDNKLARKIVTLILEQLNCQVDAVATGLLALEQVNQTPYDIIFMDIGLPDISGLSVIEQIRSNPAHQHIPIIALTAHSDKEYITQSFEAGATDYLVKPLNNENGRLLLEKYVGVFL